MPRHLVVPAELSGPGVQDDQRVGVEVASRVGGTVRILGCAAPRQRIRISDVEASRPIERRLPPRSSSRGQARYPPRTADRVEPPDKPSGAGVQREEGPAAAWIEARAASEDEPVGCQGRNVDRLRGGRQLVDPQKRAGPGRKSKRAGVGIAEQPTTLARKPIRPAVRELELSTPDQRPCTGVERVDIAFKCLHVHAPMQHERGRRIDAGEGWGVAKAEPPGHSEPPDGRGVDRTCRNAPRRGQIAARFGPRGDAPVPIAGTEAQAREEGGA